MNQSKLPNSRSNTLPKFPSIDCNSIHVSTRSVYVSLCSLERIGVVSFDTEVNELPNLISPITACTLQEFPKKCWTINVIDVV